MDARGSEGTGGGDSEHGTDQEGGGDEHDTTRGGEAIEAGSRVPGRGEEAGDEDDGAGSEGGEDGVEGDGELRHAGMTAGLDPARSKEGEVGGDGQGDEADGTEGDRLLTGGKVPTAVHQGDGHEGRSFFSWPDYTVRPLHRSQYTPSTGMSTSNASRRRSRT